ncbi:MAG TPA: DoxX family protein, partial [Thermoanaerobaculia bacterium]|nr:DoxX family protein [Thermoanaerobaculia bacterium]
MSERDDLWSSIGLLILRVGIGGFLMTHGWGKLQMMLDGQYDQFGDPIGLGPGPSLVLVMIAELICALLVVIGLGTRFVTAPIIFVMGVAAFVVHGGDPWTMGEGARLFMTGEGESWASREPALLFLIVFLALTFTGAGRFSIDALIRARAA